jgi:hypothetical protein
MATDSLDHLRFQSSESPLSRPGENVRYVLAGSPFDHVVCIEVRESHLLGKLGPDRRLARSRKTNQEYFETF